MCISTKSSENNAVLQMQILLKKDKHAPHITALVLLEWQREFFNFVWVLRKCQNIKCAFLLVLLLVYLLFFFVLRED